MAFYHLGPYLLTATSITNYFSASIILVTKICMGFILLS